MPVTIGGMASGLDTDAIIEKLVKHEARPIKQWEQDIKLYNHKKDALRELGNKLDTLNKAVRELYGFRASFNEKNALSSNESVVSATASKEAEKGVRKIEVLQLASTHKISTDPLEQDKKLPSGKLTIEVNGVSENLRFRGGTLQSLQSRIDEVASELVNTSYINTVGDKYILSIESKTSGKKGELQIRGDKKFLKEIGLIKGEKGADKEKMSLLFDGKYFTGYTGDKEIPEETGSLEVEKDGKAITISGKLWREYVLPIEYTVKEDSILEFNASHREQKELEKEAVPNRVQVGPEEKTVIKGIELEGYNPSRTRPLEPVKKKEDITNILGVGVVAVENGTRTEKIYQLDKKATGRQQLQIGNDFKGKKITKIIFYCNEGEAEFEKAELITPQKGDGLLDPKNVIAEAKDSKMKVDGVEVTRSKNEDIDDVIKGVKLNLRSPSKVPVTLNIEPDLEKAGEKIHEFVKAYNEYIDFTKQLTKAGMTDRPGDYKKTISEQGIFTGDMSLLRLENMLKRAVSDAYPSRSKDPIKMLVEMGVSTGAINAEWDRIKSGKLVVDEARLNSVLRDNPEAVKEFFGSDSDGDNRIDHGMAFRVEEILDPYTRTGNNIISSKINLQKEQIEAADNRIERHMQHVKAYEQKLRQKFANMEKSVSGAKTQGNWLKQQLQGLNGGKKK